MILTLYMKHHHTFAKADSIDKRKNQIMWSKSQKNLALQVRLKIVKAIPYQYNDVYSNRRMGLHVIDGRLRPFELSSYPALLDMHLMPDWDKNSLHLECSHTKKRDKAIRP